MSHRFLPSSPALRPSLCLKHSRKCLCGYAMAGAPHDIFHLPHFSDHYFNSCDHFSDPKPYLLDFSLITKMNKKKNKTKEKEIKLCENNKRCTESERRSWQFRSSFNHTRSLLVATIFRRRSCDRIESSASRRSYDFRSISLSVSVSLSRTRARRLAYMASAITSDVCYTCYVWFALTRTQTMQCVWRAHTFLACSVHLHQAHQRALAAHQHTS